MITLDSRRRIALFLTLFFHSFAFMRYAFIESRSNCRSKLLRKLLLGPELRFDRGTIDPSPQNFIFIKVTLGLVIGNRV